MRKDIINIPFVDTEGNKLFDFEFDSRHTEATTLFLEKDIIAHLKEELEYYDWYYQETESFLNFIDVLALSDSTDVKERNNALEIINNSCFELFCRTLKSGFYGDESVGNDGDLVDTMLLYTGDDGQTSLTTHSIWKDRKCFFNHENISIFFQLLIPLWKGGRKIQGTPFYNKLVEHLRNKMFFRFEPVVSIKQLCSFLDKALEELYNTALDGYREHDAYKEDEEQDYVETEMEECFEEHILQPLIYEIDSMHNDVEAVNNAMNTSYPKEFDHQEQWMRLQFEWIYCNRSGLIRCFFEYGMDTYNAYTESQEAKELIHDLIITLFARRVNMEHIANKQEGNA